MNQSTISELKTDSAEWIIKYQDDSVHMARIKRHKFHLDNFDTFEEMYPPIRELGSSKVVNSAETIEAMISLQMEELWFLNCRQSFTTSFNKKKYALQITLIP